MVANRVDIHDLRFEEKDAEIFKIADTKTRLDTLQNYFFPRLEVLLQDTVALVQEIYSINPYEGMTVTSRPRHRKNALQNRDYDEVYIGLTGKRRAGQFLKTNRVDGVPFSYHSCDLTYTVEPFGSLHVRLRPYRQNVDSQYISTIANLMRSHVQELSPILALYHVVHNCIEEGIFVNLAEAFGPNAVGDTMPTWRLALESPRYAFPSDDRTFPVLEGAFAVLYPLLEACIGSPRGSHLGCLNASTRSNAGTSKLSREMRPSLMTDQPHRQNLSQICPCSTVTRSSARGSGGRCWRAISGRVVVVDDRHGRMACCWRSTISYPVRAGELT